MRPILSQTVVIVTGLVSLPVPVRASGPDFVREVRPILSRHCFKCHGPDEKARKAELRLDVRESATGRAKSGRQAIAPGRPDQSELIRRILTTDAGEVMPAAETKDSLSATEKDLLRRWIASGAEYKPHWSFVPPRQVPLPQVQRVEWPRNPIDQFVLARLEAEGLRPSPPANRYILIRRVYLDLIGLPPTPEEADAFVQDESPDAYEKLVDRLLASPQYGERWTRRWLDLARYADTNGYEKDRVRSIWPYRDWVIRTINADLPFDQFTIEQIAGDMLPGATTEQRVATGFHRNTMINEEGGIDPLEFRFHATTDRVNTTATVWLGLTLGCAQCHTHKFDPIAQREYYQFMAFLNNADEPQIEVPRSELAARQAELETQIAARTADLPNRFPPPDELRWNTPPVTRVVVASGAAAEKLDDGSVRFSGTNPDVDTYTVDFDSDLPNIAAVRLEALADPQVPRTGPGRTPHGNFVLSEITVATASRKAPDQIEAVKLVSASADFSQDGFPIAHAIDGNAKTGWAVDGPDARHVPRMATFLLETPTGSTEGTHWTVRLDQQHGSQHTLGRLRLSLGQRVEDNRPEDVRRREHLDRKLAEWVEREATKAVRWTVLRPVEATANLPKLTVLDDGSVLASGDMTKRDVYDLKFHTDLAGITAVRLEVLPHESLPKYGPGRVYYEGPFGDFFLSELTLTAASHPQTGEVSVVDAFARPLTPALSPTARGGESSDLIEPVRFSRATHSFADGKHEAAAAIDGDPHTGWAINGGQGQVHTAVFNLAEPPGRTESLAVRMIFERYYAAGLGRFRIAVTTDSRPAEARVPPEIEELLLVPTGRHTADQRARLLQQFVSLAPELAAEREVIGKLRQQMPAQPTTLVLSERPPDNPRPTFVHRRGEFLQPTEPVEPATLSALHPLRQGGRRGRLGFAQWLVDERNPLVGRVTMNRHWAAFLAHGLVRTTEDFGFQGETPTHPELLDWLAVELINQQWSVKRMHRLIVTSATYQQSARVTSELFKRDPDNRLLARGPRVRLEAELIRDSVLKTSGLLSSKIGGPSVFPPQPESVTTEGTYGQLAWKVSEGEDRYRRGLYTFAKRTAPYAMFMTFDGPSGEACVARRELSNTPLQSLTLLNDAVFLDAAQTLGRHMAAIQSPVETRASELFRRCLTRPPSSDELARLVDFYHRQRERLASGELDAQAIAGTGDGNHAERAAWTVLARTLFNLDEMITKN